MRIELESGQSKLDYFADLLADAEGRIPEEFKNLRKWKEQYEGSKEIDGGSGEYAYCRYVRNVTYEVIESQTTTYIPTPVVSPRIGSEKNERLARAIETLGCNIRNILPFEKLNDTDERITPIFGASIWLVEWNESVKTHGRSGEVRVSVMSPERFVPQPAVYDIDDMDYFFLKIPTTKADIVRRYGVSAEEADQTRNEEEADDKTATVNICFYRDEDNNVCQYIWSDQTELCDNEDYYARKREYCEECGKPKDQCMCDRPRFKVKNEEYEELTESINLSDGTAIPAMSNVYKDGKLLLEEVTVPVMDENGMFATYDNGSGAAIPMLTKTLMPKMERTRLPYYKPRTYPVRMRKNISKYECVLGQSDCEAMREGQQAINKIETRMLDKLLHSGVMATVPKGRKQDLHDGIFEDVVEVEQGEKNLYDTINMQVSIAQDMNAADRLYDNVKRIIGITDSYQGQADTTAKSGKAKQIQVAQAAGRMDSKRTMKNAVYADIDRTIFELYLAFADEVRTYTYKDAFGKTQNVQFNRYDFIERDESGEYYYNDEFMFAADASKDMAQDRETMLIENRNNFMAGAYGDPANPMTQLIFWRNMEAAHDPFAKENVERIEEEIANMRNTERMYAQAQAQAQEQAQAQAQERQTGAMRYGN